MTYVPGNYSVNVSNFDSLTNVKFRDVGMLTERKRAAWLPHQMKTNPADTAAIQFAIWKVFRPSASFPTPDCF